MLSIAFSLFSNVYHRVVQQLYRWTEADRFVGFSIDTVIHMHSTQLQKLSWTSFLPSGILSLSMMCVSAALKCPLNASSSLMSNTLRLAVFLATVPPFLSFSFSLLMISDVPLIQNGGGWGVGV